MQENMKSKEELEIDEENSKISEEKLDILATPYLSMGKFPKEEDFAIKKLTYDKIELRDMKRKITLIKPKDFLQEYNKVIDNMKLKFQIKERKKRKEKKRKNVYLPKK